MALDIDADGGFAARHLGPTPDEVDEMLDLLGCETLQDLVDSTVPADIRFERELRLPTATPEHLLVEELRRRAAKNRVFRSYLGMGYHGTITPGVIRRNILENPGWYTQYTPYQAEISQGRLEALLNFQTMVIDLTGLEIANASLLDEGTAAAEAMTLFHGEVRGENRNRFFVSRGCHPQTIEVLRTRAEPVDVEIVVGDHRELAFDETFFGALVQYPTTDGTIHDYRDFCEAAHEVGALVAVAADPLALTLLTPPGEFGADAAVGSTQRFGVPMGHGGPHAAYFAIREKFKRKVPGRIIGLSVDADGNRALRMALQTREQHIRREKATSNICTSQVLLAVIAGMYAVYHGPDGLREIARRIRNRTTVLAEGLKRLGHDVLTESWFDTLRVRPAGEGTRDEAMTVLARALESGINLRDFGDGTVGVSLDETVGPEELDDLFRVFSTAASAVVGAGSGVGESEGGPGEGSPGTPSTPDVTAAELAGELSSPPLPEGVRRTSEYLQHPVFTTHHSETGMLRYIHRLETRDLSLNTSMIPLGSCTMKLNATTEMEAITWSGFSDLHPFAPADQVEGIRSIHEELEEWLAEITGLPAVSLQPNSGAQGEYTGLLVIRAAHLDRGETRRDVCLIPSSAHGTNPASAVMAGMEVVVVESGDDGTIDLEDLEKKASEHADRLAAIMITYPSTHGVFDPHVREVCRVVHDHGGLVYLDGANLNAQVGLARPGDYGADVCHINLHKTFAIPHGGGGPGMGPICATEELGPYLPGHPVVPGVGGEKAIGPVSAAPWG
ncbi:MAG: aminotransferase class V-fold PLP-dependent enzyme, partial [Longimicrobiales bacterium]|nr:aminotransferase class V-fold PLP-dependent enzyme [Longimicrobiales bacterium]